MEAGPSTPPRLIGNAVEQQQDPGLSRVSLSIPTNFLIIPPTAAAIGLIIGMSRGGSRARLRFLAENAHRQPRTVQGWYFYTKTRNYRVFFAGAKSGAKYALGLGGASALFVLLEESTGLLREQLVGVEPTPADGHVPLELDQRRRRGWREGQVSWADGAIAGTAMGTAVGTTYRLPRALFVRALLMGALLGGTTSALQRAQDHLREAMVAEGPDTPSTSTTTPADPIAAQNSPHTRSLASDPLPTAPSAGLPDLHLEEEHPDLLVAGQTPKRPWYDPRRWLGQ